MLITLRDLRVNSAWWKKHREQDGRVRKRAAELRVIFIPNPLRALPLNCKDSYLVSQDTFVFWSIVRKFLREQHLEIQNHKIIVGGCSK